MPHKSICFHTRLDGNNTVKLTGGTFTGSFDMDTVNRLVSSNFTVQVGQSGRSVFVDKQGRKVTVYVSVDPTETEAGKLAISADRQRRAALQVLEDEKSAEIEGLMSGMSHDEILKRLRAE